jgi:Fe(3+) dicitrate transport protein
VRKHSIALALLSLTAAVQAQQADVAATLGSIQVTGSWLGTGLSNSVKNFAGARTMVDREEISDTGATSIGDVLRRIPGVQTTDNSGTAGSAISLNVGVRGLTGRYSPRSTILLDGIPLAVAPYGQPQLSFAPISLANIESVDVVRGGGAVRYGPQNVGGIINFTTRAIPAKAGLTGDASVRLNHYGEGGNTAQYSTFLGTQLDSGLGLALLYSGMSGRGWREGSDERVNDLALKWRYELTPSSEVYGKVSYYDVRSGTPGGLMVAQYNANPFQNTRPSDYWSGERKGMDAGYVNTLSDNQEFEVRAYYNDSTRASALINTAGTQIANQPRDYEVLGIEPRYTHRLQLGATTHDVTVGYRYLRERGNDRAYNVARATGVAGTTTRFDNATDAHAAYVDDRIAIGAWRITPGVRFEHIESEREDRAAGGQSFDTTNNKALPSLNVAYLLTPVLTLFANYSTSYGPVQNLQLNSQTATNPLKPELAKTAELGARWTQGATSAELTVFKMKFDNQILQVPGVTPATFQNLGATDHEGIESAIDYAFDKASRLAGLAVYANFTYTRAIQKSGATAGNEVPFYSRITDTLGARYDLGAWRFNLATTHQTKQYSDAANTEDESASANVGRIPGFRLWNVQASWKVPNAKGTDVSLGINNLFDKRYYTRNVDGNAGRMVGAPRMFFVQGRYAF